MKTKTKVVVSVIALVVTFAAGRLSVAVDSEQKENETVSTGKNEDREQIIVERESPDGSKERVIKNIYRRIERVDLVKEKDVEKKSSAGRFTISALGGYDVAGAESGTMSIGAHASARVLGPVNVGIFGLSSGTLGVSVGITF